MTRCSQPMVGLMQMRSAADEALIKAISDANSSSKIMYIIDCRAWVNAVANTARGAGTEKYVVLWPLSFSSLILCFLQIGWPIILIADSSS